MKQCETCGKAISVFDVYEINGKIQCKDCAMKEINSKSKKINSSESENNNQGAVDSSKRKYVNITNKWTSVLKPLLVLLLIAEPIGAVIIFDSVSFGGTIVCFIAAFLVAFILFGLSCSFLQFAEDVSYIRNSIEQDDKNKELIK